MADAYPLSRSPIEVRLLRCRALVDGAMVTIPSSELEVLAALSLTHRPLGTEEVCDAIWPELDAGRARLRLRVYVCRLRGRLRRRDAILCINGRWRLGSVARVDLVRIAQLLSAPADSALLHAERIELRAALEDLYAGLPPQLYDSPVGERLRAAVDDALRRCAERLLSDAFARADFVEAARLAEAMLAQDPYDETWSAARSQALVRLGYANAARAAERAYAARLRELGASPLAPLALVQSEAIAVGIGNERREANR